MRKIFSFILLCSIALAVNAVPAKRGWQTRTQADGTTIEVQVIGDEYYHYMINREGQQVREINGMYEVVGEAPSPAKAKARHDASKARRQRKEVGTTPNLAPKGVVIVVNFSDKSMASNHTTATFNELCNATNCTVNNGYPSAAQYFADQSNGTYRPVFDVFGPVTLSHPFSYYGQNIDENGKSTTKSGDGYDDKYATDAVIEACILANQQYSNLNFADYDSDNDGYVDFVYVVYAGQGEANGGAYNTIWPHNWSIQTQISNAAQYSGQVFCEYSKSQTKLDGKYLDNYAMSAELDGDNGLDGIGTLCHEFGHVIGLPDLYDISYGTVYEASTTPNDWNIMDGGSYNADGHCPPNYDPWQKDFFGWHTPINLGSEGQNLTLYANGTSGYQAYQINASGSYVSPTTAGLRYYIENRQAQGWDAPLTGHGMLIWKVTFNASAWEANSPNESSTSGAPLHTIVSATGTKIGWDGENDNCPKNPFPGSGNKTSYTKISGKPLLNIAESNQVITLTYIEEPTVLVDPFDLTWKVGSSVFATTESRGKVVLPTENPSACDDKEFVGWCKQANYSNATTAPTFVKAGDAAQEGDIYYAVFAEQSGEGTAQVSDVLTKATTGISSTQYGSWSGKTLTSDAVYAGQSAGGNESIQLRSNNSNSGIVTTASGGKIAKVSVVWNSSTAADRKLDVYGKNSAYETPSDLYDASAKGTKLGTIQYGTSTELTIDGDYTFVGVRSNSGALYLSSITFTWGGGVSYSNYTTSCGVEAMVDIEEVRSSAVKVIRNGQLFIIRGEAVYTATGERVE